MSNLKTKTNINNEALVIKNFITLQITIKKDFKLKAYKKIYNLLQNHLPET
jgi:hypothetical protein